MARQVKTKNRRRTKRGVVRRPRSKAPGSAKLKKPGRKASDRTGKARTRHKFTTRLKSASRRKATSGANPKPRVRRRIAQDPRLEIAVKDMNRGSSLTEAARSVSLSRKDLQSFVKQRRLAERKGGKWTIKDNRPRRVLVITKGRIRVVTVDGYEEARLVGQHYQAAGDFVRTNDIQVIKPFDGQSVRPVKGKPIPLETDPNALHRIAAMESPPFHEIYEITSST
jgi:hypothetical protein